MELGKGYAFVARQQHIHTEKQDYYIDLVFYNYILKCFVLIDLKTEKITHQDVGQMDMYIRMYDELKEEKEIILRLESYYAQIRMKISPGIQLCTGMSSYLLLNTNFIFQQRKNCGLKLRHRK